MYQPNSKKVKVYTIYLQMHSIGHIQNIYFMRHTQYTLGTLAYMLYTALHSCPTPPPVSQKWSWTVRGSSCSIPATPLVDGQKSSKHTRRIKGMRWNGYGTATELSTAAPKTTPSALQDGGREWHTAPVSDRDTLVSNYFHSLYAHVCVCVCMYLN